MDMLKGNHITVRYGDHTVVDDLSFELLEGQWLMLVGPNGAGKTTLIKAIAQGMPYGGSMELEGKDIRRCKPAQLARKIGVLSQKNSVGYGYTVEEVVGLGRYAYTSSFLSSRDDGGMAQVERALEMTGLTDLRHTSVLTLSGGELQRTFLAQVFAQDPEILILDEPANHLDLKYQQHIFSLVARWLETPGRAVMSVVHDLSLARRYGTHAILMALRRCAAHRELAQVLMPDALRRSHGVDV